jgi:hypothetical protein
VSPDRRLIGFLVFSVAGDLPQFKTSAARCIAYTGTRVLVHVVIQGQEATFRARRLFEGLIWEVVRVRMA